MADRFRRNCGHELSQGDKFCPNCGRPIQETAHVPTPEANIPVPPPPLQAGATPQGRAGRVGGVIVGSSNRSGKMEAGAW